MIVLEFGVETLARTRLSVSPLMEAVAWLQLAATGRRHPVFGDPGPVARGLLRHPDVALVADLLPPEGATYLPDLLTPRPTGYSWREILRAQLDELESTAQAEVLTQVLAHTDAHWGRPVSDRVRRLVDSGRLQRGLAAGIARFWRETLDASWPELQSVLDDDLAERARVMAMHGVGRVLGGLHPRVGWTGSSLTLDTRYNYGQTVDLSGTDLVLAATVLNWPNTMVQIEQAAQATLYYPANRVGAAGRRGPGDLTEVVGAVRAAILSDLAVARSTAELATRHGVSASTVSYHLGALHRARLVSRQRDGRHVLYRRTLRADTLVERP